MKPAIAPERARMASQALYRRYRSQTFGELIGQEHIVQTLRNALAEGRIAHAYLFTGPRGVGKTTVARLLAKAVNCTAQMGQRPCGECEACRAIADGRAVDVIEMDAASHTSVEDAREIIERVQFRPTSGAYKVYIVDECQMLSTAAFNALLKTLEEPPGHALFILATTEVHKVPATILSRCQRFTFNRHTLGATQAQEVAALVDAFLSADLTGALRALNGVAEQGADLRQFARDLVERLRALMLLKAGGDPALLDVTEDDMATLQRQVGAADLGVVLGWVKLFSGLDQQLRSSSYGQLPLELAVVEAIAAPATSAQLAPRATSPVRPVAQSFAPDGESIQPAPAPAPRAVVSQPSEAARSSTPEPVPSAPNIPEPPIETYQPEPSAYLLDPPIDLAPPKRPVAPRQSAGAPAQPAPQPHNSAAPAEHVPDSSDAIASDNAAAALLEQIENGWDDVLQGIKARDRTLYVLLTSGGGVKPIDVKDDAIIFEVKNEWQVKRIEEAKARRVIETVLSKYLGANYRIGCVAEAQHREHPNVRREQIRNSRKDPHVKAAINIFDADIIDVEE